MSKCISRHGEYSEHEFVATEPLLCQFCGVFDEDEALAALRRLDLLAEKYEALGGHHSGPTVAQSIRTALGSAISPGQASS